MTTRINMKKTSNLKKILNSKSLDFFLEAHNGLSAKIVEEAGFKGIWASGLAMSASLGVRDNNEASWTQVLEVLEFMSDNTKIPILVDGDTGYGNFNNVRRLIKKLEQRDIAGVCIEDKVFPKTNSFINGEKQSLAAVQEFVGKIKAAKDSQIDGDFCVVARTEALIVGEGLGSALERANAYYQAGADAILIHSKLATAEEIKLFMQKWNNNCPIVIVPTTYYKTPVSDFNEMGISLVLWANQMIRASTMSMQRIAAKIFENESIDAINNEIASIQEIFRLQNVKELEEAEKRYLP